MTIGQITITFSTLCFGNLFIMGKVGATGHQINPSWWPIELFAIAPWLDGAYKRSLSANQKEQLM